MICFHCDKEIEGKKQMVGLDRPYLNIWFCRGCFNLYVRANINEYLSNYHEKIENMVQLSVGKGKNKWAKREW